MPSIFDAIKDQQFRKDVSSGLLNSANRGLAAALGGPVDLAETLINLGIAGGGFAAHKAGLINQPPELLQNSVGGSEWIGQQMQNAGIVGSARNPEAEFLASMLMPKIATSGARSIGVAVDNMQSMPLQGPIRKQMGAVTLTPGKSYKDKWGDESVFVGFSNADQSKGKFKVGSYEFEMPIQNITLSSKEKKSSKSTEKVDIYHSTYFDAPEIVSDASKSPSGGIFGLTGKQTSYGPNVYKATVDKSKIAREGSSDIDYEHTLKAAKSLFPKLPDDVKQIIAENAYRDTNPSASELDAIMRHGYDFGEALWAVQSARISGAKNAGFKAVMMSDENGTSYALVPGQKVKRIKTED